MSPPPTKSPVRWSGWLLAACALVSCEHGIDTRRVAPRSATLGDDIYGALCDRLGAAALAEDLTGASYHDVCHFDPATLRYGDEVDVQLLPPVEGEAATRARALGVAKMHAMARHRNALVKAFNAAFADVDIPDVTTEAPEDRIALHTALLRFSQDVTALYEDNPVEAGGAPIVPMMTDSFGRLFAALEQDDAARAALMRIAGRQGYRPFRVGLGAIRSLLAYPELRPFLKAQLGVLGPDGSASDDLQRLLEVVERELDTSTPQISALPPFADGITPNRPRSALEVGAALLLHEHPAYGVSDVAARYITRRDRRGFAVPLGNEPGVAGTVPAPFVDTDADGFADVDALGRFVVDPATTLITPFFIPGQEDAPPVDGNGLPQGSPFAYVDTASTLLGALARDLPELLDPTERAPADSPAPWGEEHETLMYLVSGLQLVAGPREPAQFDHASETVLPEGAACDDCSRYARFAGEASPIPDLIHAAGQVLAHPDSDVILLGLQQLLSPEHRPVVARLVGAALRVKAIADAHDALAAQGVEPKAELAHEVPVWDEMAQIVDRMLAHPGLVARLLVSLADPVLVSSHGQHPKITGAPSQHFGQTLAAFMRFRDTYSYDPQDINGPAYNVTDGYPSFANPHNEVDRAQPLGGDNRSMFSRAAQMIYDGTRVRGCNKDGARIFTGLPLPQYWPLFDGSYAECDLFTFDNVGAFYLDAQLPAGHPKRAELVIQDGALQALLDFAGLFISQDAFLEMASGLDGLTLHPEAPALNRLMFFGAASEQWSMPDFDAANQNSNTARFISNAIEPLGGRVCPPNQNGVATCGAMADVLRLRDAGTIFAWERLGFYDYLRPQMLVWAEVDDADTGENMFLDLVSTLWRHWSTEDAGAICQYADPSDPRYCSGAGIARYEPILAEAFDSDLIPALHAFAVTATSISVTYERGPKAGQTIGGHEIVELLVRILFDQSYAASAGMRDRAGQSAGSWVDGTPQAQVTPYMMFADALHRIDRTFDDSGDPRAPERKAKWKRARSNLVDVFLAVEGEGNASRFANPATPEALRHALSVLRAQLNANCPDRESGGGCAWAAETLSQKASDALSRPVFATVMDVLAGIEDDETARRALERFMSYALTAGGEQEALGGMLASLTDLLQLLVADGDFAPIFNAVSTAASPREGQEGPGCADRTIQVLHTLVGDRYDRYHVLDHILPALVTPMNDGTDRSPLEVMIDAIADIHRIDASASAPLDESDYGAVMRTLREFMLSETRGMHQLYTIVQNRPR